MHYDYLLVGAGLFNAVFCEHARRAGKSCLVVERMGHIAGNIYTEKREGIDVHVYGAHIFHTSDEEVWNYVQKFATFNGFINRVKANYKGKLYSMPFNMYTFGRLWGVKTAEEAKAIIDGQRAVLGDHQAELQHVARHPGVPQRLHHQRPAAARLGGRFDDHRAARGER